MEVVTDTDRYLTTFYDALSAETIERMEAGSPDRTLSQLRLIGSAPYDCQVTLLNDPVLLADQMLASGSMSDVTFLVGAEKVQILAHKVFLTAASQVFYTMFFGSIPEGNTVLIPDVSPEAFYIMLQYIYTGVIPTILNKAELGLELLYVARKYLLQNYEIWITTALVRSFRLESILPVHSAAILLDSLPLERACWEFIDKNMKKIMFTKEFLQADEATLHNLVHSDLLDLSELRMLQDFFRWCWSTLNHGVDGISRFNGWQNLLRPFLANTCYPRMSLCNGSGKGYYALNEHDIIQILQEVCVTTAFSTLPSPFTTVPIMPRQFALQDKEHRLNAMPDNQSIRIRIRNTRQYHQLASWLVRNYIDNKTSSKSVVEGSSELFEIPTRLKFKAQYLHEITSRSLPMLRISTKQMNTLVGEFIQ